MALGYRASYLRWSSYTGCLMSKNASEHAEIISGHLIGAMAR